MTQQHVFITGGGSGIGHAIATKFRQSDYKVTVGGRNRQRLEESGFEFIQIDVSDAGSIANAVHNVPPIDIFVANAGAAKTAPALKTSKEDWDQMLAVNLTSMFHCSQIVLPQMVERGWGRFIAIASTASVKGYKYCGAYAAAKHGVLGWVKCVAIELARTGVTANAICPGFTKTPLVDAAIEGVMARNGTGYEDVLASFTADNPMQRLVEPDEVAALALWLGSQASASVNGQALAIDGGETAS